MEAICSAIRVDGDHQLIKYFIDLNPLHFKSMMTVDQLATCVFCEENFARVKKVGTITITFLLNHELLSFDPESVKQKIYSTIYSRHPLHDAVGIWVEKFGD